MSRWWPWLALALAGCGNPNRAELAANRNFDCRDRSASYLAIGSMIGAEAGVMIDCRDAGPRLVRWTVDRDGNRDEQAKSLSVAQFERVWEKVDGTGWRYLKDCAGTGEDGDPIYNFDVIDWNGQGTFACQNRGPLPYPYFILADQLDLAVAEFLQKPTSTRREPDDP